MADRRVIEVRDSFSDALTVCRVKLDRNLADDRSAGSARDTVTEFVRVARVAGAPPERTLAAFKEMVQRLPAVEARRVDERGEMMRVLVQMAIEAYYPSETVS